MFLKSFSSKKSRDSDISLNGCIEFNSSKVIVLGGSRAFASYVSLMHNSKWHIYFFRFEEEKMSGDQEPHTNGVNGDGNSSDDEVSDDATLFYFLEVKHKESFQRMYPR